MRLRMVQGRAWRRAAAATVRARSRRRPSARWCSPSSIISRTKLDERGFFRPATKKPGMRRNLRNIFHRMELTQQDVRTLWGAVVRLAEGPRVEVQTRKRVRPKKTGRLERGVLRPKQRPFRLRGGPPVQAKFYEENRCAYYLGALRGRPAPCHDACGGGGDDDDSSGGGDDDGGGAPSALRARVRRRGFLRDGVAGEAEVSAAATARDLIMVKISCGRPQRPRGDSVVLRLNSR